MYIELRQCYLHEELLILTWKPNSVIGSSLRMKYAITKKGVLIHR